MKRSLLLSALTTAAALVGTVVSPAYGVTGHAAAAPTCNAADSDIYAAPTSVAATPGTVLSCRPVSLTQVPGNISMTAWKVRYSSTDNQGRPIAVSGTVAVPAAPWTGPGTRPIVAFNPGTLGLGPQCAFSKQLAGAYQDEYEGDNIAALLKAGYGVAATDGAGYLDGQTHPYVSGTDAGHALLDIARAATALPASGLSPQTSVGLWGYSEGGAASLWAAQLATAYAPDLHVVGDASGGVPGDLKTVAASLEGGAFSGFLADAAIGIHAAYQALPFDSLLNDDGRKAVTSAKSLCLAGTTATLAGKKLADYTKDGLSLDQLYQQRGTDGRTWGQVLDAQKLGVDVGPASTTARYRIPFPVLQYRGLLDEVIPTSTEDATRAAYCSAGITTAWRTYPGDHLLTDNQAIGDVVNWFGDRFAGRTAQNDC
ncbi:MULTISPECIES: lipase family protein [Streptomyces]|uniref:Putative secreted protein n=1 Tax=Streptomyces scabiei (strain 87.22) TaxID=680198 RepID=C9Z9Y4_STRSW|nr:lipase family protein [Streptomyces scabiei]KFG09431.1 triacylglycerol lipase [Streptomyces scabiei]MDX2574730.1 lipase family protein [Streptomyces scabiei]MDX2651656.1 lipase family protein [Streptomyces scabiei]MDX2722812.1 lipase family protein [Streptomyces scabiei]MDX2835760.1 lipase family protein [Streptomyces scabiei]